MEGRGAEEEGGLSESSVGGAGMETGGSRGERGTQEGGYGQGTWVFLRAGAARTGAVGVMLGDGVL